MKLSMTARICAVVVFLAAVAFGVVVGLGVYSNGYQSFRSRYITCGGQAIKVGSTVELKEQSSEFTLTGAGFKFVSWGDYDIQITVNPDAQAVYTADETVGTLDDVEVTEFFGIERTGQAFSIENVSLQAIVERKLGTGATVTEMDTNKPQYIMTVTDGNSGKSYEYKLHATEPISIEIDPDRIIVW